MTEKIPKQNKALFSAPEKYRAHNVLGAGGMKVIIQSDDINACREVAMAISKNASEDSYERFLNEARITASLEHPNIVPVHEIGKSNTGAPYFTMKLVHGCTLEHILKKLSENDPEFEAKYPLRTLLEIFLKVCDGIAFAHSKGIIHLDLKPDNIQVGDYGEVLVLDWGLAKKISEEQSDGDDPLDISLLKNTQMTLDGIVKGTPEYMAPEQAAGRNSRRGRRTDIYSLGAILYSMLTLNKPFGGENTEDVINNVLEGNVVPPHTAAKEGRFVPQALEFVVYKAMERNPVRRYSSVADLKADVLSYMNGYATVAEEAGFFTKALLWLKRKKVQIYIVTSLTVTFCILFAFLGSHLYYRNQEKLVYGTVVRARLAAEKTIAGLEERIYKESVGEWKLKFEDPFSDLSFHDRWGFFLGKESFLTMNQTRGYVKPSPGSVRIFTGQGGLNMAFREPMAGGDMRMLLEVSWQEFKQGGMLLITLNNDNFDDGYIFAIHPGEESYMTVMRGRTHELLAEHVIDIPKNEICKFDMIRLSEGKGTVLKMSCNGSELINYRDSSDHTAISKYVTPCAFSFVKSSLTLHSVKLMTLGTPIKADLLDIADRQIRKGNYAVAKELYIESEESASTPERRMRAAQGMSLANLLSNYKTRIPEWSERLTKAWRGASVSINIEQQGFALTASGKGVDDLSVLRDMPLSTLVLSDTGLKSIEQLRDMKIRNLSLIRCGISDLSPLAGMNLHELFLDTLPVKELPELRMKNLKHVTITNCGLKTLDPLKMLKLEKLDVSINGISDLSPLENMPLKTLNVAGNLLKSIDPLLKMPLEELNIAQNAIVSIESLRNKKLRVLTASGNEIADISALVGMPLSRINLSFNRLSSLAPLKNMAELQQLIVMHNNLTTLDECATLDNLTSLYFDYNKVTSLEPLRNCMNLRRISFSDNLVSSLAPLAHLRYLRTVNCSGNPLTALTPLKELSLNKLYAHNTADSGFIDALRYVPKHFIFSRDSWSVEKLNRLYEHFSGVPEKSPVQKAVRILLAYRNKDKVTLRSLASEINGKYYIFIPVMVDYATARKDALLFGARLPSWKTPLERGTLIRNMETPFWLGLRRDGNRILWDDGSLFYTFISAPPDIKLGCVYAPGIVYNEIFANNHPEIKLPLVLEWSR